MIESLLPFVQTTFHPAASALQLLGAGMFSQAYRFNVGDAVFVVRIGVSREAFEKDQLAYKLVNQVASIPRILAIGEYANEQFYCISEWKPGQPVTNLSKTKTERLLPSLFGNILALSRVPVQPETHFGLLNGRGKSRKDYPSWADFISAIHDFSQTFTPRGDELYQPWESLFDTTFLDQNLVREAQQRLLPLLPSLPNERHYVHGDFGFDNVLAKDNQLTAILDWAELRCGDWLYDLAYVAYHDSLGIDYTGSFQQWAKSNGLPLPNFAARMNACFLSIFLGNVFLEANRGQRDWYEEDIERYKRFFANG